MRIAAVFCLLLGCSSEEPDGFKVVEKHETTANDLRRITTTVQNGDSPLNRFIVERVLPAGKSPGSLKPIILSPGLGQSNKAYTVGLQAGGADFESSIAANLARGGADVFLYSTRQALLAPGSCDNAADCPVAKDWGLQARLDDYAYIRKQIAADHGSVKPVVGGLSLGAGTSLAAANQNPDAYAGLLIIEYTAAIRQQWRAGYQALCDGYRQKVAGGALFDTALVPALQALLQLSAADPNGASPLPGLPSGVTNRQAYLTFLGAQSPGPPASVFFPGLVLFATSVPDNKFLYSSEELAASHLGALNQYTPMAEFVDFTCSMGGETTFSSNLKSFTRPVLAFEAGAGVGAETQVGLDLLASKNIQVQMEPGLGHVDLVGLPDHAERLEKPILDWLNSLQ